MTHRLLSSKELWGTDLTAVTGLNETVAVQLKMIDNGMIADALRHQTAGTWNQKLMMHQHF